MGKGRDVAPECHRSILLVFHLGKTKALRTDYSFFPWICITFDFDTLQLTNACGEIILINVSVKCQINAEHWHLQPHELIHELQKYLLRSRSGNSDVSMLPYKKVSWEKPFFFESQSISVFLRLGSRASLLNTCSSFVTAGCYLTSCNACFKLGYPCLTTNGKSSSI